MQILTHLILNDMVKVKGQISEMALCIVDADDRISGLAKLFFSELAKKVYLCSNNHGKVRLDSSIIYLTK